MCVTMTDCSLNLRDIRSHIKLCICSKVNESIIHRIALDKLNTFNRDAVYIEESTAENHDLAIQNRLVVDIAGDNHV